MWPICLVYWIHVREESAKAQGWTKASNKVLPGSQCYGWPKNPRNKSDIRRHTTSGVSCKIRWSMGQTGQSSHHLQGQKASSHQQTLRFRQGMLLIEKLPGQGSLLTLNFAERYTHTAVSDLQKNWSSTFLLERDQEDAQSMNSIDVQKEGVWCIFCTPLRNAHPALRWPNKLGTELNERNAEMANASHASLSNCKNCEAQKNVKSLASKGDWSICLWPMCFVFVWLT